MNRKLIASFMVMATLGASALTYAGSVENQDTSFEAFKEAHMEWQQEKFDAKVADGIMTQEEADKILASMATRMENCDGEGYFGRRGNDENGQGKGRGFGRGNGNRRGAGGCRY